MLMILNERLNIEGGDLKRKKRIYLMISLWKEWFLSESKSSVNSPNQGLSKADYIEFTDWTKSEN